VALGGAAPAGPGAAHPTSAPTGTSDRT
jgi:hypothetical protein